MPRPTKCRRVCHYPDVLEFVPVEERRGNGEIACPVKMNSQGDNFYSRETDQSQEKTPVIMTIDEYETIRLIDHEGMSQEQCCELMQVARTTVQKIYDSARKKLAAVLVEGLPLRIEGGEIRLCDGKRANCGFAACYKQEYQRTYQKTKGDHSMRIAVTYEDGQIFQHFGHTQYFKVYEVEDGKVIASVIVDTNGSGHGALAGVLNALNAEVLICGGIGGGAQMALAAANIKLYGGVSGDADAAVEAYLAGNLDYNPNVKCNHHGDHHHEGGCGNHGCGSDHHCGGHH